MRLPRGASLLVAFSLLTWAAPASAGCARVLSGQLRDAARRCDSASLSVSSVQTSLHTGMPVTVN